MKLTALALLAGAVWFARPTVKRGAGMGDHGDYDYLEVRFPHIGMQIDWWRS